MVEFQDIEGLMVWIMNRFAEKFGSHAVLKGGMELRLVDCPRFTNDLDYVFIPYTSKKEIAGEILAVLKGIPDAHVSHSMNSKCIRYLVSMKSLAVQIEVNVSRACESQELSTAFLARKKGQQGRIIRVMDFDCALAHKLAAWNERELMRDLYDLYYLAVVLDTRVNRKVLQDRLSAVESRKKGAKKSAMSLDQLVKKLEVAAETITRKKVDQELRDYLEAVELPGLDRKIVGGMRRVIMELSR